MEKKNRKFYRALPVLLCAGILSHLCFGAGGLGAAGDRSPEPVSESSPESFSETASGTLSDADSGVSVQGDAPELSPVLPRRFDARAQGRGPAVKSQGSYGTCWALAATSALEASLLPDLRMQFSADHMALNNRFSASLSDGGDYVMVMAYLSGWQGPVTEEEDPYGDAYSPDGLLPAVHVQEIRLLENCTREEIKEAVYRYGAVQTSLWMTRKGTDPAEGYYSPVGAAWYDPQEKTQNHDVIILGWDDGYSRFHFSRIPPVDGAFICQNSWGEKFGEDGIFYVSYADANIARVGLAYSRIEAADNYDFLYQTDDCGWVGQQGYASETCWFANVYTAGEPGGAEVPSDASESIGGGEVPSDTSESTGGAEVPSDVSESTGGAEAPSDASESTGGTEPALVLELAAFGLYAAGPDTVCELYLAHDFEGPDSFSGMKFLQKNELEQAGYYTIDLREHEALAPGERFAMIVKITTPGEKNPAVVEYRADEYSQNVTTEGKEGYLSQDGEYWENTEQKFGSNVCLKGYLVSD